MSSILLLLRLPRRAAERRAPGVALASLLLGSLLVPGALQAQEAAPADVEASPAVEDEIPAAPPPPPLGTSPAAPALSPPSEQEQAGPRPLLPPDAPADSPADPPAEPAIAVPDEQQPETAPDSAPASRSVALPESPGDGETVPLPPRRPTPPPDFAAVPPTAVPTPEPASPPSGERDRFTDDGSQRFSRDLGQPRSGFRRVEGDMLWERAPIPQALKTACTTKVARLGSSLAASFKDQGLWVPAEKLTLSVDCDDGEERPIGTFLCEAQDFAPVLDLSCRLERPAR